MLCRCSRNKLKAIYLTRGDLSRYEFAREKSAEVIVLDSNEPCISEEVSQMKEGLNIELFPIRYRPNKGALS